jgi:hypothetical protein
VGADPGRSPVVFPPSPVDFQHSRWLFTVTPSGLAKSGRHSRFNQPYGRRAVFLPRHGRAKLDGMTEAEWQTCTTKPKAMFRHVHPWISRRKAQLLSCSCCRLVWDYLIHAQLRSAIETAERYTDGECSENEFANERNAVHAIRASLEVVENWVDQDRLPIDSDPAITVMSFAASSVEAAVCGNVMVGLNHTLDWVHDTAVKTAPPSESRTERVQVRQDLCDLFREIVGNPFRPWKVAPDFLGGGLVQPDGRVVPVTDTVRSLAAAIYAERAYDRLPVLADAVEEAGVTDPAMLDHLRHGTAHARGCWALDLLLGKG